MRISHKKLIGIPVVTRSGQAVGKLADFEIATETGRLETLVVRTSGGLIPGITHEELRVAWSQIVSLSDKEAVVADGTVPIGAKSMAIVPPLPGSATDA